LGLDVIVEVHTERELAAAIDTGAQVIGINNRDLKTFVVDLSVTERLAPLLPPGVPAVCESGIDSPEQIRRIEKCGIHVFLIGEALMREPAPGQKLNELLQD
jgi:indole-3-glycerol phosphate synthase